MIDSDSIQVRLERLVYGGDAMGRLPDGRVVFVPFGLPNELVTVKPTQIKNRYIKGQLLTILEPSSDRIAPRCRHFSVCGGCHYQHLAYQKQFDLKRDLLRDQLVRIGGLVNPLVLAGEIPENSWNYRNTIQFHTGPTNKPGYRTAYGNAVVEIEECHLPAAVISEIWPTLDLGPVPGLERIELRAGSDESVMLVLESSTLDLPDLVIEQPLSVVINNPTGSIIVAGDDYLDFTVLGRNFQVSAASFFQVNTSMAEKLVSEIQNNLEIKGGDVVLDLYCGVGLFSAFLAPKCKELIGIEVSPSACSDFAVNLDEFDHVSLYESTAEKALPALKTKPNVVLVDPPRAGLDPGVTDKLVEMKPSEIAYVSCDQATLARDLARLVRGGYSVLSTTMFDLFPQTASIESITYLKLR